MINHVWYVDLILIYLYLFIYKYDYIWYPLKLAQLAWRVQAESWEAKSVNYNDYKILSDSQEQFASFCHLEGVEWMFHFELKWDKWANNPCQRWRVCESLPEFEPPSTCKWKKWRLMVTHAVFCIRKLLGVSWIPWIPCQWCLKYPKLTYPCQP